MLVDECIPAEQHGWTQGRDDSPVAMGVPGQLLGLQVSYYSYILGTISWQGNSMCCENQHQDVCVQSSPSSSPVHTIMTLRKWIPWLCKNAFCRFAYCLCQGRSLTSGHSWADILGCDLALCCTSAGAPHLVCACSVASLVRVRLNP